VGDVSQALPYKPHEYTETCCTSLTTGQRLPGVFHSFSEGKKGKR